MTVRIGPTHRRLMGLVLLLLAFFCWRLGQGSARRLEGSADLVILQNAGSFTARDHTAMESIEKAVRTPSAFAIWSQQDKQAITTRTDRRAEVALLTVRGDTRLVLPMAATLSPDDQAGCLMDNDTAFRLTGGGTAIGATILCRGREYIIRGTFDSPKATVILQAGPQDTTSLTHMSVRPGGDIDTFILRHGLSPTLRITGDFYRQLARLPLLLAPCILLAILYSRLLRLLGLWKAYPIRRAMVWATLAALTTGCFVGLLALLPSAYIPTLWSDFGFWSQAGESLMADTTDYLSAARLRPDLLFLGLASGSFWGVLACLPLVAGYRLMVWPPEPTTT